jgi:hypothetical protein
VVGRSPYGPLSDRGTRAALVGYELLALAGWPARAFWQSIP